MQINCTAVIGGPWTNQLVDSTSYGTSLIGSAQGRSRLLTIRICRLAISETLFDEAESVTFSASATAYTNDYKWNSCLLHSAEHRKQKHGKRLPEATLQDLGRRTFCIRSAFLLLPANQEERKLQNEMNETISSSSSEFNMFQQSYLNHRALRNKQDRCSRVGQSVAEKLGKQTLLKGQPPLPSITSLKVGCCLLQKCNTRWVRLASPHC